MDSIEGIKIDCDEGGFYLVLEGDFVREFEAYLATKECDGVELRLPQDVALKLANVETVQIREWWAEGLAAAASYVPPVDHDDCGYERDDPKHPDFHDVVAAEVDAIRKREREQRADWINPPGRPYFK